MTLLTMLSQPERYAVRITTTLNLSAIQAMTGASTRRIIQAPNYNRDSTWKFYDVCAPVSYVAEAQQDWALDLCRELDSQVINIIPSTVSHLEENRRVYELDHHSERSG